MKMEYRKLKPYLLLWGTQSLSALGSAMTNYALVIWLYQKSGSALETALLAVKMSLHNRVFQPGEGLVDQDVEDTIYNIGRMGREGMKATDNEILNIMLGN